MKNNILIFLILIVLFNCNKQDSKIQIQESFDKNAIHLMFLISENEHFESNSILQQTILSFPRENFGIYSDSSKIIKKLNKKMDSYFLLLYNIKPIDSSDVWDNNHFMFTLMNSKSSVLNFEENNYLRNPLQTLYQQYTYECGCISEKHFKLKFYLDENKNLKNISLEPRHKTENFDSINQIFHFKVNNFNKDKSISKDVYIKYKIF